MQLSKLQGLAPSHFKSVNRDVNSKNDEDQLSIDSKMKNISTDCLPDENISGFEAQVVKDPLTSKKIFVKRKNIHGFGQPKKTASKTGSKNSSNPRVNRKGDAEVGVINKIKFIKDPLTGKKNKVDPNNMLHFGQAKPAPAVLKEKVDMDKVAVNRNILFNEDTVAFGVTKAIEVIGGSNHIVDVVGKHAGRLAGGFVNAAQNKALDKATAKVVLSEFIQSKSEKINETKCKIQKLIAESQDLNEKNRDSFNKSCIETFIKRHDEIGKINKSASIASNAKNVGESHYNNVKASLEDLGRIKLTIIEKIIELGADGEKQVDSTDDNSIFLETIRQYCLKTLESTASSAYFLKFLPLIVSGTSMPAAVGLSVLSAVVDTLTTPHASKAAIKDTLSLDSTNATTNDIASRAVVKVVASMVTSIIQARFGILTGVVAGSEFSNQIENTFDLTMTKEEIESIFENLLSEMTEELEQYKKSLTKDSEKLEKEVSYLMEKMMTPPHVDNAKEDKDEDIRIYASINDGSQQHDSDSSPTGTTTNTTTNPTESPSSPDFFSNIISSIKEFFENDYVPEVDSNEKPILYGTPPGGHAPVFGSEFNALYRQNMVSNGMGFVPKTKAKTEPYNLGSMLSKQTRSSSAPKSFSVPKSSSTPNLTFRRIIKK